MAVKGGRVLKSEKEFKELEQQAEEIEEEMDELYSRVDDTIEGLKKLNKGVLTELADRKIRKQDYNSVEERLDELRHELEEELRLAQTRLEDNILEYKKGVWDYSPTLRNYCKKSSNEKEEFFKPTSNGPQFKFNSSVYNYHNASKEEQYLVKKTYYYDRFTTRLEKEIKVIDEKITEAERKLKAGQDPRRVVKSLYNHVSRFLETASDHNTLRLSTLKHRARKTDVNDFEDRYDKPSQDLSWKEKIANWL